MADSKMEDFQKKCDEAMDEHLEDYTIDNILRKLIKDSDLIEVLCCLDMIAMEENKVVCFYDHDEERIYPAPGVLLRSKANKKEVIKESNVVLFPVEAVYKGSFFKGRHRLSWRVPIVCEAIVETFGLKKSIGVKRDTVNFNRINSVVDVGCAIGEYVGGFIDMGITAWGIEGSKAAKEFAVTPCISYYDMRIHLPKIPRMSHDLCISLEVAEHIEEKYADVYLDNLCHISNTVLITAAPPDQEGHGHVNCQKKPYWIDKMNQRGYVRQPNIEKMFENSLKSKTSRREVLSYANNVMIFVRSVE